MGKYSRVLLKLSGEALAGEKHTGFDEATCMEVGKQVKALVEQGVQVAVVIGGGNFWRGRTSETIDRVKADQIGMLATVMNCIYVSDIFRYLGLNTKVYTPFACGSMSALFSKDDAMQELKKGTVVFCAGGTGHPYFTTDTAAVLRATEINADIILLGKSIDAVYSADPKIDPTAQKYEEISYMEVLEKDLKVMDSTATAMCRDNKMPLLVFGIEEPENIVRAVKGEKIGTIVK